MPLATATSAFGWALDGNGWGFAAVVLGVRAFRREGIDSGLREAA